MKKIVIIFVALSIALITALYFLFGNQYKGDYGLDEDGRALIEDYEFFIKKLEDIHLVPEGYKPFGTNRQDMVTHDEEQFWAAPRRGV